MNFSVRMTSALILMALGATIQPNVAIAFPQEIVQVLNPEEISLRVKQTTVRVDGSGVGSGVIIDESNNVYTVLTNWHVVKKPGEYTVQTIDGRQHKVDKATVKQLGGLDLALLQFSSNQNYQLAEIGNSDQLVEGQSIYFAGYPGELREEYNRYYRFFTTNLVGILPPSTNKGYTLIYNGEAFPGMSGGPVFDKYARLIGVNGEANINAITGATSIYAIPINTYTQARSNNIQQVGSGNTNNNSTSANSNQTNPNSPNTTNAKPPEVTVETTTTNPQPLSDNTANNSNQNQSARTSTEITPNPQSENNSASNNQNSSVPVPTTESEGGVDSNKVSSVPTFSPSRVSPLSNPNNANTVSPKPTNTINSNNPKPTNNNYNTNTINPKPTNNNYNTNITNNPRPLVLISSRTGIDYTSLRNLLAEGKWEEADRQTYDLIEQIIKTAKNRNSHMFIELKSIAEFSCTDIKTIDQLWRKYSGGQFGFSPQQQVWSTVNQNGDFSTETWRSFATQVGWKQGDVASGSGYLLYEQLSFNPATAPKGHLPWWFALPQESQNVIKHLFARCNLN
jgi:hypothetical protein